MCYGLYLRTFPAGTTSNDNNKDCLFVTCRVAASYVLCYQLALPCQNSDATHFIMHQRIFRISPGSLFIGKTAYRLLSHQLDRRREVVHGTDTRQGSTLSIWNLNGKESNQSNAQHLFVYHRKLFAQGTRFCLCRSCYICVCVSVWNFHVNFFFYCSGVQPDGSVEEVETCCCDVQINACLPSLQCEHNADATP